MLILPLKTPASRIGPRLLRWLRIYLPMQETRRRCEFDSWVGKIPWERKWQPTTVFLPGKFHGWRRLAGCRPWDLRFRHN